MQRKNFIAAVTILVIALAITLFGGCSKNTSTTIATLETTTAPSVDNTTAPVVEDEIDNSLFREVETSSENMDIYRAEVQARLKHEKFLTQLEEELIVRLLSEKEDSVLVDNNVIYVTHLDAQCLEVMYFPVLFWDDGNLILWYTAESGFVYYESLSEKQMSGIMTHLHENSEYAESMCHSEEYAMTYNSQTAQVTVWKFGKEINKCDLPENSIYCGRSSEGHIFRSGSDVFAVKQTYDATYSCNVFRIAKDVQYVIDSSYCFGHDFPEQPLFQMVDGTIKCYVGCLGTPGAPEDDTSCLQSLWIEGGFH